MSTSQRNPQIPTTSTLAVSTQALTKTYGGRTAVDAIELHVRKGEIYGFLGPNGAGKTTTIRMILGLITPTSGRATVLGEPAGTPDMMHRVGALVEGPGFYPYLSGRANLEVMARLRDVRRDAVDIALERVRLTDRADDRFRSYSLGMKQRLGVACALLGEPDLIVLDEPTNGLDPVGMAEMRSLLVDLASAGHTVLLSSHLLGEVQEVCDRVGVVAGGKLLRQGTVAELRGGAVLRVRAEPVQTAFEIAARLAGPEAVQLVAGPVGGVGATASSDIEIKQGSVTTGELVRELVHAGVEVHSLTVDERSLEQVFFDLTTTSDQTGVAA